MANAYDLIPDVDSRGIPNQKAKFRQWNPDPVGGEAANLAKINPDLARVIAQARADNPNLHFVLGSGARTAQQQNLAQSWGWSPVGAKGGGDAAIHMRGNAADLWPVNDQGQIDFDAGQQKAISAAMKAAADKLGVNLNAGGDWKHPDAPHFELPGNPNWMPPSGGADAVAPHGTTLNSTPAQPAQGATNSPNVIDTLARNIAQIESGGAANPYTVLNPRTHAIGKYQVMPSNVAGWTLAATGHQMTPEQFRASPSAQEAVFRDQMQRSLELYGPKDAASIWFTGKPYNVAGGNISDGITRNADYVRRATAGLDGGKTFQPGPAVAASQAASGSPTAVAGGPAAPAATGQPAAAAGPSLPGFTPGSAGEKMASAGLKSLAGGGADDKPPDMPQAPSIPLAQAVGGPMMLGPGGQNVRGQQVAQQDLMQQGYMLQPSLAAFGQPPQAAFAPKPMLMPGQATGMPSMPGTTLNSPSQLQMALMSGQMSPYDMYAGGQGGGYGQGSS